MAKTEKMTAAGVRRGKVGSTLVDSGEYQGLRCSITNAGARFWYRYKCPLTDKLKSVTLGYYDDNFTLVDAREKILALKAQRANGQVPAEKRADVTVEQAVGEYVGALKKRRTEKGVAETGRILAKVTRALGPMAIETLGVDALRRLALVEVDKGNHRQAGVMLNELAACVDLAQLNGHLPLDHPNPVLTVKRLLKAGGIKTTGNKRQRFLSDSEITQLLAWLPSSYFSQPQRVALTITLFTGCRSGEAVAARWDDVDLAAGLWQIPHTKTGVPRTVLMPAQLVAYLAEQPRQGEWVCQSQRTGSHVRQKAINERKWLCEQRGYTCPVSDWTPHDLRRTARTGLSRLGCPREIAEAALGHSAAGIVGVYDLHRFEAEAGEWLQHWADHICLGLGARTT